MVSVRIFYKRSIGRKLLIPKGEKLIVGKTLPIEPRDNLLSGYQKPEELLIGENSLLKQLTNTAVEYALEAEMTNHLGMPTMISLLMPATLPEIAKAVRHSEAAWGSCRSRVRAITR